METLSLWGKSLLVPMRILVVMSSIVIPNLIATSWIFYFEALNQYLSVGSPVYFVVESGHDYTTTLGQDQICGGRGCSEHSLLGQIYQASEQSNA